MKLWKIILLIVIALAVILFIQIVFSAPVQVLRTWTAPADLKGDGTTRRVASYDLRYSTTPITAANFATATQVTNEPSPNAPGQLESCFVSVNEDTRYWYAIKSADSAGNISGISNIYDEITPDKTGPQSITDLK